MVDYSVVQSIGLEPSVYRGDAHGPEEPKKDLVTQLSRTGIQALDIKKTIHVGWSFL